MCSRFTRSQAQKLPAQLQIDSGSVNECGVFNIIEVDQDGNCLFTSILDFFDNNRHHFKDAPRSAHEIRMQSVDYVMSRNAAGFQSNWERFVGNIQFNLEKHIVGLTDYGKDASNVETVKYEYKHTCRSREISELLVN